MPRPYGRESWRGPGLPWLIFGGLAAVVALLAITGLLLLRSRPPSRALLVRAAAAHQRQTLGPAPVSFASGDLTSVAAWARGQTGASIEVPALDAEGYRLLGVRLAPELGRGAVSLVYEGAEGRVTCTLLPSSLPARLQLPLPEPAPDIHATTLEDTDLATWTEGKTAYVMVARLSPGTLLELAQSVARTAFEAPRMSLTAGVDAATGTEFTEG